MSAHNSGSKRKPIKLRPDPPPERTEVDMLREARRRNQLHSLDEQIAKLPDDQRGIFQRLRRLIT